MVNLTNKIEENNQFTGVMDDYKCQADNMFKEVNAIIEELTVKVNSIEDSLAKFESKFNATQNPIENKNSEQTL